MKRILKTTLPVGACVATLMALGLGTERAEAGAPAKTAQSIMVNFNVPDTTLAIVQVDTYKYNLETAAALFSNAWDGNSPTYTVDPATATISTVNNIPGTAPTSEPECTPEAPAVPDAPAPDSTKLKKDDHPGHNDVVGDNQCAFLDGTALSGLTYTQTATASSSCTYKTYQQNGSTKYTERTIQVTHTYTYTYTYNIASLQPSYSPLTAWDFVGSTGGNSAEVGLNAFIAGESVVSSARQPLKYSFSIEVGGVSRVQNLAVYVDYVGDGSDVPVATPGSTVKKNLSNTSPTLTDTPGQLVFGPNGELDFYYVGNAGSNGNTYLLTDNVDARALLNSDSFVGNNNGGADGSALAGAEMDQVTLALSEGDHTVTLKGTVKDNSGLANLPFTVTKTIHIVSPGCGGP